MTKKTAIVHDWFMTPGGAEKVVDAIYDIFPSPIYTLIKQDLPCYRDKQIITSFLQKLPGKIRHYRKYLPFFPLVVEQFDLSEYDVIISSSHCVAKGVITNVDQLHICYCHTPMRYAWDLYHHYLKQSGLKKGIKGILAKLLFHYLRNWDQKSSYRVDEFIANSNYIARRIKKIYRRDATVIYPPVDVDRFTLGTVKKEYYVTASRMVLYKKIDLIVEAFSKMEEKTLIVIGDGPDYKKIKKYANKNIRFLGRVDDDILKSYLQEAKGFVFAAIEDFGILPVEAQLCGTPVIAFNKGGAKETVKSGGFFDKQTVTSLIGAIERFENETFDPKVVREKVLFFNRQRFQNEFKDFVEKKR